MREWRLRTGSLPLAETLVMGILNVTPDSFSDGDPAMLTTEAALARGLALATAGADIVDVGGESTRPYATRVPVDEELERVVPVVEGLAAEGIVVSIDTMKPDVAHAALDAGAEIVNDVSGFRDDAMAELAVTSGAGLVVMHMKGTPADMQDAPVYDDVVAEVKGYLAERIVRLTRIGVEPARICIDPGIGFGKTFEHNITLLAALDELTELGAPLLVGVSRKGFVGALLEAAGRTTTAAERDTASAVLAALAIERGADVVRAHDVTATVEAIAIAGAMVRAAGGGHRGDE